jgi:hypothetical protein
MGCKSLHITQLIWEDDPPGLLSVDEVTREISILVRGKVVYTHHLE